MPDKERIVKTDEKSVFRLCNSLNALQPVFRHYNQPKIANLLLDAQATITKLYRENKALRKEKEDHE